MAEGLAQHLDRSLARLRRRTLVPVLLLAVAWGQELVDQLVFAGRWNLPMVHGGPFWGLLTAPFSHAGFGHLISNSLWFLPLSWLVLLKGSRDYLAVWLAVLALEIPVWLFWPSASHGLSGVNYALLGYLLLIGWLEKRPLSPWCSPRLASWPMEACCRPCCPFSARRGSAGSAMPRASWQDCWLPWLCIASEAVVCFPKRGSPELDGACGA